MSINNDIENIKTIDFNNIGNESISENNQFNNEDKRLINEYSDINYENIINDYTLIKSLYKQKKIDLNKINEKINKNNKKIEEIKVILSKLKEEKNKKQIDIVNLLSKKETLEEVYKNQIILLTKKSTILKDIAIDSNNKGNNDINDNSEYRDSVNIITNIINNSNEQFDISIEEMKEIEIKKFMEQVISMMEEIFDKKINKFNSNENNEDKIV